MTCELKNYSSGMLVRLAFATAIQVDAEILLIDEVLAVGDAAFQQKCFEEFFRLKREGRTIVFVSHDMYSVERFCNRAMLMEHGKMTQIGEPRAIGARLPRAELRPASPRTARRGALLRRRHRDRRRLVRERRRRARDERTARRTLTMCFEVRFGQDLTDPVFAATLRTELGHTILVARSDQRGASSGSLQGRRIGDRAVRRAQLAHRQPLRAHALAGSRGHRQRRDRAGRGHDFGDGPRQCDAAASWSSRSRRGSSGCERDADGSCAPCPGGRRRAIGFTDHRRSAATCGVSGR